MSNAVGGIDTATVTVQVAQRIQIDIKPGSTTNAINLNNDGTISVVLFSSATFNDANVDVSSVRFAGASAIQSGLNDINHDGLPDMVLPFRIEDTNLRKIYSELLVEDANDGTLDSTKPQTTRLLSGSTTVRNLWEGLDSAMLFMTGQEMDNLLIALGLK